MGDQQAYPFVAEGRESGSCHLSSVEPCCRYKDGNGESDIELHLICSPSQLLIRAAVDLDIFPKR